MRIVIFTSNAIRHKYLANELTKNADGTLVISECKPNDSVVPDQPSIIQDHFALREKTEKELFYPNSDSFLARTVPVLYKEANLGYIYDIVKEFNPDMMFAFGSCLIKEPLLSLLPKGRFINLHLGLSPYYRGAGTNFWPLVNKEPEFVGSTILYIDKGIDTGDIISHVRPNIEVGDNIHTIGCKVIEGSTSRLIDLINIVKSGGKLNRVKQWGVQDSKFYSVSDFNEEALLKYKRNIENGLIEDYLKNPKKQMRLI